MSFTSNDFILAVVAVVIIFLIRTLVFAGKEINSSKKFPHSNRDDRNKKDNENHS